MSKPAKNPLRRLVPAAVLLFLLVGFGIDWWRRRAAAPAAGEPVRITSGGGLATDPAISRDGKWLAYASDGGAAGALDVWIRPLSGGEPRRLTTGNADNHKPAFSPDGRTLAFRSERGEGGIYTVPTAGGEPRLLAPGGRTARYSPDGKWLAFWTRQSDDSTALFLMPAAGGAPRRLAPAFRHARDPVWSPDGRHLLFYGNDGENSDWFTVGVEDGAAPARTGAHAILGIQTLGGRITPLDWAGGFIYFAAARRIEGRSANAAIWRIPITPRLLITEGAQRVTSGKEAHARVAVAPDGSLVYATVTPSSARWSLPLDSVAPGTRLAAAAGSVLVSPSGRRTIHAGRDGFVVRGGEKEMNCQGCRRPFAWSPDEKMVLHAAWRSNSLGLFYTATGERRDILRTPDFSINGARFSPDNRWLAIEGNHRRSGPQLYIVPFSEGASPLRSDWIALGEARDGNREPCWSADGNTLYFLSTRDGFRCIWSQRLDRHKRPRGEAAPVRHFHEERFSLAGPQENALAMDAGKLVVTVFETRGELWRARMN